MPVKSGGREVLGPERHREQDRLPGLQLGAADGVGADRATLRDLPRELLLDHDVEARRRERVDGLRLRRAAHVGDRDRPGPVADDERHRRAQRQGRLPAGRRSRGPRRSRRGSDAAPVRPGAPRRRSLARAFASGLPVTSGTWTGGGPFEGTNEIVVPTSRSAPGSREDLQDVVLRDRRMELAREEPDLEPEGVQSRDRVVDGLAAERGDPRRVRDRVRPRPPGRAREERQQEDRAHDALQACDASAGAAPSVGSRPSRGGRRPPSSPPPSTVIVGISSTSAASPRAGGSCRAITSRSIRITSADSGRSSRSRSVAAATKPSSSAGRCEATDDGAGTRSDRCL